MSHQLFEGDVLFYQRILASAGFYNDTLDGVWGSITDKADRDFTARYVEIRQEEGGFDPRSKSNIATLLPIAQIEARKFLTRAAQNFARFNVRILSGSRTYAEQEALFAKGGSVTPNEKSRMPGPVKATTISASRGMSGFSTRAGGQGANQQEQAYIDLAHAALAPRLEWGGSWTSFVDRPHYQLRLGFDLASVRGHFEARRTELRLTGKLRSELKWAGKKRAPAQISVALPQLPLRLCVAWCNSPSRSCAG